MELPACDSFSPKPVLRGLILLSFRRACRDSNAGPAD
jgi:hypothetical protein